MILTSQQLPLKDGRRLGYVDYGDPAGRPVLLFHGLPGSRLQGHPDRAMAGALGIRLIGVDRPGYGLSDDQPERSLLDWPDDIAALADGLGLERFAVLGISGGGPYAAACAWKIPQRLTAVALVSSMGPLTGADMLDGMHWISRLMLGLARGGEWPLRLPAAVLVSIAQRWPKQYLDLMNTHLPPADQAVYERPEMQNTLREDLAEAFRQGPQGALRDILLLTRPWGFLLERIPIPVQFWHGEQDATVPVRIGRALAAAIPRCQARFPPAAGHFLVIEYWRDILTALRRAADA